MRLRGGGVKKRLLARRAAILPAFLLAFCTAAALPALPLPGGDLAAFADEAPQTKEELEAAETKYGGVKDAAPSVKIEVQGHIVLTGTPAGYEEPLGPGGPDAPPAPSGPDVPPAPRGPDVPPAPSGPDAPPNPGSPDVPPNPDTPDVSSGQASPDQLSGSDIPDVPSGQASPEKPPSPDTQDKSADSPKTGDDSPIWLYAAAGLISLIILLILIFLRKRDAKER
jgi:LPXTG-motif cell wall-anchored protein